MRRRELVVNLTHLAWPSAQTSRSALPLGRCQLTFLHWPNEISDFSGVVTAFEKLRSAGKIRAWGV